MECKGCQYHTADGRCLYVVGCPYRGLPSFDASGAMTITLSEASSKGLIEFLEQQDREWIDRLMDGKESLTRMYGGRKVTLHPSPEPPAVSNLDAE